MKLREVIIKNFRNLVDVKIPIGDTTILVGENNSGKTALLDALRITFSKSTTGRRSLFEEYDYHMSNIGDSPQTSEGIVIDLWFKEDKSDEWSESLVQALNDIVQTDPILDLDSIGLRLSSTYDNTANNIVNKFEFLSIDGQPLGGRGAIPNNLTRFYHYIHLFYLSALRDYKDEFSPRSQFWGRILRDLKISDTQKEELIIELGKINSTLLTSDPRLEQVTKSLDNVQKIISAEFGQNTSIQALPVKPWELMSKSEIVIKNRGSAISFPLSCHGQGVQSLSVLFLFQAYIEVLLKPTFEPETEALLALEEPEAHLHPQATRALAANLSNLKSQKIITSHSPYFIQEIPFTCLRIFRRSGPTSKVLYIKRAFSAIIPNDPKLITFCAEKPNKFNYHEGNLHFTVNGKIEQSEYRKLLTIYSSKKEVHPEIKRIFIESQMFLTDAELADLETCAKRIRGEIFFARAWLLCEGQCEYLLLRFFSELLNRSLDQYGVTIIDFQNNGSPGAFVGLARIFKIPWILVCDNDDEGARFLTQLRNRMLTVKEISELAYVFPEEGMDLELFLAKNGFINEYMTILQEQHIILSKKQGDAGFEEEIAKNIRKNKTKNTLSLIEKLTEGHADQTRVPVFLVNIINKIIKAVE